MIDFDVATMIDVSNASPEQLVKEAYALSQPQGLGFLHAERGPLADEEVDAILDRGNARHVASMDYVLGRACKFTIFRGPDDEMYINRMWYDHTVEQLESLLVRCGVEVPEDLEEW